MRAAALLLTAVTACALAIPATGAADPGTAHDQTVQAKGADQRPRQHGRQTSDGVRGAIAPYVPRALRTPPVITRDESPGRSRPASRSAQWDQIDTRGPIRAYLLTIDPATPGVAIDYASSKSVRNTETVRRMIGLDDAIAGVNGDFYDIFDTGAPARPRGRPRARAPARAPVRLEPRLLHQGRRPRRSPTSR